ncbi:MAG: biosynthetic arginine decarboxylase [Methylacidiphilales bacterium]|nr:biosynthetic arginine decarboxylase [Candidatus Methylacidiphilales bacterium]
MPHEEIVRRTQQEYALEMWGAGYFHVNAEGHIVVSPLGPGSRELDLYKIVNEALDLGLSLPMLVRFQDILRHRVQQINEAFRLAIQELNYAGQYRGVFPIKVNQLREVVEEVISAGAEYHFGLEVGSKPELFAALALHRDPESLLICNGYKDEAFIRMALLGRKLGKKVILVVEKLEELLTIIPLSEAMQVNPMIGIRVRLTTRGAGKWALSGGEDAKFGLSTADVLEACRLLENHGMRDNFRLLHFHIGSQVPDISILRKAVREGARYYAKIRKLGFDKLNYLDVGGGLGIDYDGSRSMTENSTNYTLQEYARSVVSHIRDICAEEGVSVPDIVSESGRAAVAHHSVLILDVFGFIEKTRTRTSDIIQIDEIQRGQNSSTVEKYVRELRSMLSTLNKKNRREYFHNANEIKEDVESRFNVGIIDLHEKAAIETLYWLLAEAIVRSYDQAKTVPDEVKALRASLAAQFLCNFSIFQSLIDHWGLGQLFPIVPIHRLSEPTSYRGTLVDITCDSDGRISRFVSGEDKVNPTLALHHPQGKPYYLGIFLMGAYQDIMGDMHNLFGRVNEAHIFLDEDEPEGYYIEETIPAATIAKVLEDVQYDSSFLVREMKEQIDKLIKEDHLRPNEGMKLLEAYEKGLQDNTYLRFHCDSSTFNSDKI